MDELRDLTPFLADPCWQFVLLARQAGNGVILRTGPAKWWQLIQWDTETDRFTPGQWFHGSVYPRKCDVAPDGRLWSWFGGKFRAHEAARGYGQVQVVVARPPYFTALALWPADDTWGGHTAFLDDGTFCGGTPGAHHPAHPPGPLRLAPHTRETLAPPWARTGWRREGNRWVKGALARLMGAGEDLYPGRAPSSYALGEEMFEAHWADFDQRGRLVAAAGGRILEGRTGGDGLRWRVLAEFQAARPERGEAPEAARRW